MAFFWVRGGGGVVWGIMLNGASHAMIVVSEKEG